MTALFADALNAQNPIFDTDSYKYSHATQYPDGTEYVSSYIEPRKAWEGIDTVLFFGLQIELAKLAQIRVTQQMIDEAAPVLKTHGLELYLPGWQRIVDAHDGKLPVLIEALPEGTMAPVGVPQMRIQNTDPACWWLPSFLETRLLRAVWYPSTVASLSHYVMGQIQERMMITDGSTDGAAFKLHDFGARGASSGESAAIGGLAHLVSAMGTDTAMAIVYARKFYGADMAGFSIPATEHSTMTALGEPGELDQMRAFLDRNPKGLIACVSDSYDLMRAVRSYWGEVLRDQVLARDGVLVVRPDSGDPVQVVPDVIEALIGRFGATTTPQGYRLLNNKVRVIQGDGVNRHSIIDIMDVLIDRGLAIGNIAFGMGGGLLQKVDRDCFSYSMKASALYLDGQWHDIYKDPITAKGTKTSKRGRQGVMQTDSGALVARRLDNIPKRAEALRPVFRNGILLNLQTLDEIRTRAWPDGFGL
ncbi:nicotinate phosphoribosyltransferase [Actibacterium sp. 188UL27-1]|uniref:nicotinate phosphoribosyltransferase n=1 Tax=Actibacterium sp. 188UL27-1 TaxID=2786961 RepID=UPI00195DD630|nr:nicotinate phosphoribosyltransferase [Actibacterium sp. 188UL27-1]MBM7066444.1 nicotinate phosphoribosyltransferase [Actibacterium sp. 188UL27-1]